MHNLCTRCRVNTGILHNQPVGWHTTMQLSAVQVQVELSIVQVELSIVQAELSMVQTELSMVQGASTNITRSSDQQKRMVSIAHVTWQQFSALDHYEATHWLLRFVNGCRL